MQFVKREQDAGQRRLIGQLAGQYGDYRAIITDFPADRHSLQTIRLVEGQRPLNSYPVGCRAIKSRPIGK